MGKVRGCFGCLTLWLNAVWRRGLTYCVYSVCACEAVGCCICMWMGVCLRLCDLKLCIQGPVNRKMVSRWDGLVWMCCSLSGKQDAEPRVYLSYEYVKAIRFLPCLLSHPFTPLLLQCLIRQATRLMNEINENKQASILIFLYLFLSSQTGIVCSTRVSEKLQLQ